MKCLSMGTLIILMSCSLALSAPLSPGAGGSGVPGKIEKSREYKLPKDPKAVVVSLNFSGGRLRVKNNAPTLTILANGTILIPDKYGYSQDVKSEISKSELQKLLHFIIEENKFLEHNEEHVAGQKKDATRPIPGDPNFRVPVRRVMDASTTTIFVHAEGKKLEVKEYALSIYVKGQYKNILELQRLLAVQRRLSQVIDIAHAGGLEGVNKILKLTNKQLKQKYPTAKPLTLEHFKNARTNADGSKKLSFRRTKPGPNNDPKTATYTIAEIKILADGKPLVTIHVKLK